MDRNVWPKLNDHNIHSPVWVHDVLTKDECKELIFWHSEHKHLATVGGITEYVGIRLMHISNIRIRDLLIRPTYHIISEVYKTCGVQVYPEMVALNSWHVGSHQEAHTDVTSTQEIRLHEDGYLPLQPNRPWTCIFYLNDDFRGGEGYFVDHDGTENIVEPVVGSGIVFQGIYHKHGVKKIRRAPRMTISYWFTDNPSRVAPDGYCSDLTMNEDTWRLQREGKPFPRYEASGVSDMTYNQWEEERVFLGNK